MSRPHWYLSRVKPLQNHSWTDREKLAVFTLRSEEDIPARRVAIIFGVTKTQIYNVTRLVRRGKNKECFSCGRPLSPKERKQKGLILSCETCKVNKKEYKRKRRNALLKKGICPYCEKRKLVPGKKGCIQCISATHRRRYNQGLCGNCGQRPIARDSDALCTLCLKVNRTRIAASRTLNSTRKKKCPTGRSSKK